MLRVQSLSKAYGGRTLFEGVQLDLRAGDRVGLVGRNGEGKTTLLRVLAGLEPPDDGRVILEGGATIGYLRQEVDTTSSQTVIDEVRTAHAPLRTLEARMRELEAEIASRGEVPRGLAERYDAARQSFERAGGFSAEAELRATLVGLGFASERWEVPLRTLSGGWIMRAELAKLLLARPSVLLLDEPTNHLDLPSIQWFEGVLAGYPGAVVVVSHDREFLDRHATRIVEIERGRITSYPGNYSEYERRVVEERTQASSRARHLDARIAELERFVERFGAKASKAAQAHSKEKMIERLRAERERLLPEASARRLRFRFPPAPRSGQSVLRLEGAAKRFGDARVYESLDLELERGQRVAVVGPNGTGKSTLLRLAAGSLEPDRGTRELGHNVRDAFYAQHQLDALDPSRTVLEEVESAAPLTAVPRLRTLLGVFLFSGDEIEKRVSVLSGGEKARVALAKLLLAGANFLILDEPTNHLDIQARDVLAAALSGFEGTMLFTSHDRRFIGALATHVLEVSPGAAGARVALHAGGLSALPTGSGSRAAPAAGAPAGESTSPSRRRRTGGDPDARERERRRRRLEAQVSELEREIGQAELELRGMDQSFADPELARDGERMRQLKEAHSALHRRLRKLYDEWESAHEALDSPEELG
jgi:ATP-binding cassette subfamily F protein 3